MREIVGDLFDHNEQGPNAICITTNGFVNRDGANTMGAGCALQAKQRWPGIHMAAGTCIQAFGNRVHLLTFEEEGIIFLQECHQPAYPRYNVPYHILTFPTKDHWKEDSDPELIRQSAERLVAIADERGWKSVVLPWPGCGCGRLNKDDVRVLLAPILDDRFYIISPR